MGSEMCIRDRCLANSESIDISKLGDSQNLKDKEILEFLGDD